MAGRRHRPSSSQHLEDHPYSQKSWAQQDDTTQHQASQLAYDNEIDRQLNMDRVYNSPPPENFIAQPYQRGVYANECSDQDNAGGYNIWQGNQIQYRAEPTGYDAFHQENSVRYVNSGLHADSPPTPAASDLDGGRTRNTRGKRSGARAEFSGRPQEQVQGKGRTSGSARNRKAPRKSKADKIRAPRIDAPLSELTKNFAEIPVKDMESHVNRSAQVRQDEARRKGKVSRPMNSFMLYRSAYAERTKHWCTQNNHQVVSSVSGESWPLEPADIKAKYIEYAKIERANHGIAHPDYKFQPSKNPGAGRKRKDVSDDSVGEPSDLDEDLEWTPSLGRRGRTRSSNRRLVRKAGYLSDDPPIDDVRVEMLPSQRSWNRSSFQASNPGKQVPAAMSVQSLHDGQYYETIVNPYGNQPNIEDVIIRKAEVPVPLVGFPSSSQHVLLNQQPPGENQGTIEHASLDPSLLDGIDLDFSQFDPNTDFLDFPNDSTYLLRTEDGLPQSIEATGVNHDDFRKFDEANPVDENQRGPDT